jgi:hypothetical protein
MTGDDEIHELLMTDDTVAMAILFNSDQYSTYLFRSAI